MELVFELMDLSLARTYQAAIRKDDQAALELWKFINTYQGPVAESYRELEANKLRSALGVISAAEDWESFDEASMNGHDHLADTAKGIAQDILREAEKHGRRRVVRDGLIGRGS